MHFKGEDSNLNLTFVKFNKEEVCPSKLVTMQKPSKSGRQVERKRFKPPTSPPIVGSAAVLITSPDFVVTKDAVDICFRLSGELLSLPQNAEEEAVMDKTVWDFMMKKAENNESYLVENNQTIQFLISAETEYVPEELVGEKLEEMGIGLNSRGNSYAPKGQLEYFQSWTGAPLKIHRPGLVSRQTDSFYKLPRQSLLCSNSM